MVGCDNMSAGASTDFINLTVVKFIRPYQINERRFLRVLLFIKTTRRAHFPAQNILSFLSIVKIRLLFRLLPFLFFCIAPPVDSLDFWGLDLLFKEDRSI